MSRTKKLLHNPSERKQKLLTTTRETLKRQKKKSNQPAPGRFTSYQVKQLDKLYTKGGAAFGSIANLKKASGFTRGKIVRYLQTKAPYTIQSFIETEFSHGADAKKTWLRCQGYKYEPNPAGIAAASRDARQVAVRESEQITLYGKLAVDFFSCEKHLVSGVTLRLSFRRSEDDFVIISETAAKNYKVRNSFIYNRKRNKVGICREKHSIA